MRFVLRMFAVVAIALLAVLFVAAPAEAVWVEEMVLGVAPLTPYETVVCSLGADVDARGLLDQIEDLNTEIACSYCTHERTTAEATKVRRLNLPISCHSGNCVHDGRITLAGRADRAAGVRDMRV